MTDLFPRSGANMPQALIGVSTTQPVELADDVFGTLLYGKVSTVGCSY